MLRMELQLDGMERIALQSKFGAASKDDKVGVEFWMVILKKELLVHRNDTHLFCSSRQQA